MKKTFNALASVGAILVFWEVSSLLLNKYFLPSPFRAAVALMELLQKGTLYRHIASSGYRLIAGTLAGLIIAIPLGILMGRNKKIDDTLGNIFRFIYPIPKVVFMPIVIVMLGIGDASKIFLIGIALLFQITVIIRDSAAAIKKEQINALKVMNATPLQILYHVLLPGCLPGILTSLKASIGTSVALLLITEVFASVSGLGYFIMNCMDCREYDEMYAGIVMLALLSAGLYSLIEAAEKKFCKWNYC